MNEDLRQWFAQNWVDISRKKKGGGHPACGASADKGVRAKDSSKKYPKCVPANKAKNMSKKQKKSAVTRKRRAPNEPGSPDNVRTDVKKENWEKWKPRRNEVYSGGMPSNNAPENPEPMGGAVAFEKSRKRVLADLREFVRYLVADVIAEGDTGTPPFRRGKIAQPVHDTGTPLATLKRLFKLGEFTPDDLIMIANNFLQIINDGKVGEYVEYFKEGGTEEMPNLEKFNEAIDNLEREDTMRELGEERKENIRNIVGKFSQTIEFEAEQTERKKMGIGAPVKASREFSNAVHSYLDMVNTHVSNPEQRQRIGNWIRNVRFDPNIPEEDKERMILGYIRSEMNPSGPARRLNERIQRMIIKVVLQEKKLYG